MKTGQTGQKEEVSKKFFSSPGISKSDHFIGEPLKLWTSWRKSLLLDMVTSSQPSSVLHWESNFIDR